MSKRASAAGTGLAKDITIPGMERSGTRNGFLSMNGENKPLEV